MILHEEMVRAEMVEKVEKTETEGDKPIKKKFVILRLFCEK